MTKYEFSPPYTASAQLTGVAYAEPPPPISQQTVILTQPSAPTNVAFVASTGNLQSVEAVIIKEPGSTKPIPLSGTGRNWNHELIKGCCDDCRVGALGYFCTPCMLCCIFNSMDELTYCVAMMGCAGAAMLARTKIRSSLHIKGSFCGDICCALWCNQCVACQMYKELREIGQLKGNCCYCGCDSEKQCLCT